MIGIIAAVSANGVIGVDNKLPFDYPADMKHFRTTTAGATVIMGRKTWESIGRLLPKRRNIVISRNKIDFEGLDTFSSIKEAIDSHATLGAGFAPFGTSPAGGLPPSEPPRIWLIGGASVYEEGMEFADQIVLTLTPDIIKADNAVRFPWINPMKFVPSWAVRPLLPEDPTCPLKVATYVKV
jgi:dihydrofolate reductase